MVQQNCCIGGIFATKDMFGGEIYGAMRAWLTLREMFIYFIYLALTVTIAYFSTNNEAYYQSVALYRAYIYPISSFLYEDIIFDDISNEEDFWGFVSGRYEGDPGKFLLLSYSSANYNPYDESANMTMYRNWKISGPKLYQHRFESENCDVLEFYESFIKENCSQAAAMNFSFIESFIGGDFLNFHEDVGEVDGYWRRGRIVHLDRDDIVAAKSRIDELRNASWIDRGTKAVITSTKMMNVDLGIFSALRWGMGGVRK